MMAHAGNQGRFADAGFATEQDDLPDTLLLPLPAFAKRYWRLTRTTLV